eukprot:COSAG04_NODE_763_length_10502_cov_4.002788_8_plen_512_part_00
MWFIDGVAGIRVRMSHPDTPLAIRAGVDAHIEWAKGHRESVYGTVRSSWALVPGWFVHNVSVPGNAAARVMIPSRSGLATEVTEGGTPLSVAGDGVIKVLGTETVNGVEYVALRVLSGRYQFGSRWSRSRSARAVLKTTEDDAIDGSTLRIATGQKLPSLRKLAAKAGLFMGTCVDAGPSLSSFSNYTAVASSQFSIVTAEGSMKWAATQPTQGEFVFTGGDQIVAAARKYDWKIRGHNLVWDIANPAWLYGPDKYTGKNFTGIELRSLLKAHIDAVVGHWRGKVYSWDVVNEGISSHPTPHIKENIPPWQTTVWWPASTPNETYLDMAFRWAHAADPGAKLFYNDGCAEGQEPKAAAVYDLLKGMLARGVPVHGVGLEMHFSLDNDACNEGYQSPAAVEANMHKLASLGLEVHVTEMDVKVNVSATGEIQGNAAAVLQQQAAVYAGILRACLNVPACKSWGVWGFFGRQHKDLLDAEFGPKPAFWAAVDELKKGRPTLRGKSDDGPQRLK